MLEGLIGLVIGIGLTLFTQLGFRMIKLDSEIAELSQKNDHKETNILYENKALLKKLYDEAKS